jgi:carbon monoxide dehydrogenase subunit G
VASFSHTVEIPRPPAEVFPWLLDEDKVPQWTGHLERYERVGDGRMRQVLDISGRKIDVTLEVTKHNPPHSAETRFSTNGIDVVSDYRLEPNGAGTRLTQSIDAKARSLSARMLVPVVKPRLEQKVTEDLERLKETLSR